jgi:tRNA U34 5-methylaminomethyl-2-thiouridine-forming methyltransferase MnmC
MPELVLTEDGSHTVYVPELKEHYHSIHGAVQESSVVYIMNGLGYCSSNPVNIFEVGFGTGLNALLSCIYSLENKLKISYTSAEKYPLDLSLVNDLNHYNFAGSHGRELSDMIHAAPWGKMVEITRYFELKKIRCDLVEDRIDGKFNLIFFDAFGPDKQPEMWTSSIFKKISEVTEAGGILVTYSAKGEVKRMLKSNGFKVAILPGPPGKREMIRATKL